MSLQRKIKIASAITSGAAQKILPGKRAKQAARKSFAQKLVALKGVPMKVSQMLASDLSTEQENAHVEALEKVEAMELSEVNELLEKRAPHLKKHIDHISEKPFPASLGQVHKVTLKSGEEMALKLQYPNMSDSMELDQHLMGLLTHSMPSMKKGFDLQDYQKVIRDELEQEMDYEYEADRLKKLHEINAGSGVVIPEPLSSLSGKKHLCMTWEPSEGVSKVIPQLEHSHKLKLSKSLATFFCQTLFNGNMVHADPNPGNYGLRRTKHRDEWEWVVYDAGSVIHIPRQQVLALLKLTQYIDEGRGNIMPLLKILGFNTDTLAPLKHSLSAFFEILLEPFLSSSRYDLNEWNRSERIQKILDRDKWNFMISAPANFILPMRFIQGFLSYSKTLNVGVHVRPMLQDQWRICRTELDALEDIIIQDSTEEDLDMDKNAAKHLYITVKENGHLKVKLTLPRASIHDLDVLIDEHIKDKLKKQNISLEEITLRAQKNGYRPQTCFELRGEDKKDVLVELK